METIGLATLEELTERVRAGAVSGEELGRSLKLDLKGEGVIMIRGAEVSNENGPADLVITARRSDLMEIGAGRMDPLSAVMTGRLRLSDMALAMELQPKLQALFSRIS